MAKTPRLDPYERLIYRFYEALYLLCLLGNVRGPHVATIFDPSSFIAVQRRFLKNLAFLCDNIKGGDSTASIAVQNRPDCNVFWLSSNQGPSDSALEFLSSVLADVKLFATSHQDERARAEDDLTGKCVRFSLKRLRTQAHSLVNCARRCRTHLLTHSANDQSDSLAEWLLQFECVEFEEHGLHHMCKTAYRVRKDAEMLVIERLGHRFHNEILSKDTSTAFSKVRHIIGRLAAHIRAVKQLLDDSPRLDSLLDVYEVSAVFVPPSVSPLKADAHTNLDGIMTRMFLLGNKDARFAGTLAYLSHMNQQVDIEGRLLDFHDPARKPPSVHAEVQMLHHFYDRRLAFVAGDRYIATSKPACMCCKLYFRHHPAACVEPDSHERVWPSWGPVLLPLGQAEPGWTEQREVLTSVSHDIRRQVMMVIEQNQAVSFAHPDSVTGITHSSDISFSDSEDGQWDHENEDFGSDSEFDGGVRI